MLKRLNSIKDAVSISKSAQQHVNGGFGPAGTPLCSAVCPTAPKRTFCWDGGPHCPAECDGYGGWYNY